MYGLSDPELERQANDKISFLKFLGFPQKIPDHSTIWFFRERHINQGKLDLIGQELQRQQDVMGLKIQKNSLPAVARRVFDADVPRREDDLI